MLAALAVAALLTVDGGDAEPNWALPTRLPASAMAQVTPVDTTSDASKSKIDPLDNLTYSLALGASASNVQSTTQITPFADLVANFPIVTGHAPVDAPPLRIQLEGIFGGLPGQNAVNPADINTFKTVSFAGRFDWVFGTTTYSRSTLGIGGGVSSRIGSGPTQPLTKNPGHGEILLTFAKKDHTASFSIGPGFSNETGDPATVLRADARLTIQNWIRIQVATIVPIANALSNYWQTSPVRNVLTVVAVAVDMTNIRFTKPGS
jgi:hypothetical protein